MSQPISPAVLAALQQAEDDLHAAKDADGAHGVTVASLALATKAESDSATAALAAHGTANTSALAALAAVRVELGLPPN